MSPDQKDSSTIPGGIWSSLSGEFALTPEQIQSILRNRAKILGRETLETISEQNFLEVLTFMLADERYAIELKFIREVYPLKELTPVPCTPPFVIGIVNIRGEIISVIDLKKLFNLPQKIVGEKDTLIVINDEQMEFGIQADSILGVCRLAGGDFQKSLPTLDGVRDEFLKGVTNDRLIVLDGRKLLSDNKIIVHEK
ncbi:MAG: chemotaxis protein CheW [Candidatus Ozemobacteraceae bacterium]